MVTAEQDYQQLAGFLAGDPGNPALIADTAKAALAAGRPEAVFELAERHRAAAGTSAAIEHLAGSAALAVADWPRAIGIFEALVGQGIDAPGTRCNFAWALAMGGRKAEAMAHLDAIVAKTIAQGAQLLIALLHEAGDLDRAEAEARAAIARFPDHRGLNAAVSVLAIDIDDPALAHAAATRAGDHPDALTTLATLALDDERPAEAQRLFERALARDPSHARARIGRGLAALASGDGTCAAADLDHGAAAFGDHLGAWIAAGWAHMLAGDRLAARERFERALAIDATFAEAHGSLAVVDLIAGNEVAGRRGTDVALRLDRSCFSGTLAAAMLATGAGNAQGAERIVALALDTPVDASGRTIGQALAHLGARG